MLLSSVELLNPCWAPPPPLPLEPCSDVPNPKCAANRCASQPHDCPPHPYVCVCAVVYNGLPRESLAVVRWSSPPQRRRGQRGEHS